MKKTVLISVILLFNMGIFMGCSQEEYVSPQDQLAIDIVIIDKYLADNNITAIEDETGVRYIIDVEGTGKSPTVDDMVNVNYEGRLMSNGIVFDDGNGIEFPLANVINGWKIGFPFFKEGGSGTLYIPSGWAYGRNGSGSIPSNAILIFDIDLLEVK